MAQEHQAATQASGQTRLNLVVVPCGGRKLPAPAQARELYVGSYHRACRRAAAALAPHRTLILSARHGLVDLDQVLAPYDITFGDPTAVAAEQVAAQADQLGLRHPPDVVVLGGRRYVAATRRAWPHARDPLAGTRSMGAQVARLTSIARLGPAALLRTVDQPVARWIAR